MDVGQLRAYINRLEDTLAKKVSAQRALFESTLSELSGYASAKAAGVVRAVMRLPRQTRAKAKPKYRSKKHPRQT
jgi:hypothetical protein